MKGIKMDSCLEISLDTVIDKFTKSHETINSK